VFRGVSRSRRDCGNREAAKVLVGFHRDGGAAVAATAAIVRRQSGGGGRMTTREAAVAATAAIVRRFHRQAERFDNLRPQSPRLRQS